MKIGIDPEDMPAATDAAQIKVVGTANSRLYVSIGNGNRKIGLIPSWSLPNVTTCNPRLRKFCANKCYSNRIRIMFPGTWEQWKHNLWMVRNHPVLTELLIRKFLYMALPQVMRIHVSGDFYSAEYLDMWRRIARDHPKTVFYGYSKMDGLDHDTLPGNMRILRSRWPGMPAPKQLHAKRSCWVQDGTDKRVPGTAFKCPGDCPKCGFRCAFGTGDVVIPLHR